MTLRLRLTAALAVLGLAGTACAQDDVVKAGAILYQTHSHTNGISGIGVPAGANVDTDDATTLLLTYERMLRPNLGVELVLGWPPKLTASGKGSIDFLGSVLTTRTVAPTLLLNYHFGDPGARWRPYVGAGVNYTHFADIESPLASKVEMSDSFGWALQAGVDYAFDAQRGLFASIGRADVSSKVVASGPTVLKTRIDFRPVTYSFGMFYRF
jgi:outer membrane protein